MDLTLPATAPAMAPFHDQPQAGDPSTALYTLIELSDAELEEVRHECELEYIACSDDPGLAIVALPPQARFAGQPLRAVFEYHVELVSRDSEHFEPRYFIAVVDADWKRKGVLLITLDDDELLCNVDSFRTRARETGLLVANLQIANMDWAEIKESYELQSGDEEDGIDGDDEGGHDDSNDDGGDGGDDNDHPSSISRDA